MVVIYNNINFKDIKRDKQLSHISVIHSLITAAIIYYPKLPLSGLYQSIYNPIIPLNVEDIYCSPSFDNKLSPQISHYFIANAIKGIHLTSIKHIFKNNDFFP
jgi:hypothetical protein